MIAGRPIQDLTRGLGRNAFDLPVAALAGLAAAVIAFTIPGDLLGRLVSATGLPHLLAAAEPPLGLKARAAIGVAGAGIAFGLVFLLMRLLDRAGRARPAPVFEEEEGLPRLRRRDLHPDAPVCRPISATRDFGEPAPPPLEPAGRQATPAWFTEPAIEADSFAPEPEPASDTFRPEPEAELAPEPEPEPEPAPAPRFEPQPDAEPLAEASLPELMRRLEQGLARRRSRHAFTATPAAHAPAPQVFPEPDDDRLQSAIESLQRFAARAD